MSDIEDFFKGPGGDKPKTSARDSATASPLISLEAKAEVRAAAVHLRGRATHAARLAHESAAKTAAVTKGLSASLGARMAGELAKPIAWMRVGKAALFPALLMFGVAGALMVRDHHRVSVASDEAAAAVAKLEQARNAHTAPVQPSVSQPAIFSATAPAPAAVVSPPTASALNATPVAAPVQTAPVALAPATTIGVLPVPRTVARGTCAFGLSTLQRLEKDARARALSAMEAAWIEFGYACVGKEFLGVSERGFYAAVEKPERQPERTAEKAAPENANVAAVKPRPAAPLAHRNADKSSAVLAPLTASAATCAKYLPAMNDSVGGTHSRDDRTLPALIRECASGGFITARNARYVLTDGSDTGSASRGPESSKAGTCSLRGAVVSQDSTPLAGASVSITGLGIAAKASTTTDANGSFSFSGLPQGSVSVSVEAGKHFAQKATLQTCGGVVATPIRLERCSFLMCKARQLDQKLGLGRH